MKKTMAMTERGTLKVTACYFTKTNKNFELKWLC